MDTAFFNRYRDAAFPDFHIEDAGPVTIDPSGRFANEWTLSGSHEGDTEQSGPS